jgi:SAM-dependent methyltransferase
VEQQEYAHLDRVDRVHWFYRGKRAIVRYWIRRSIAVGRDDILIDGGTGTGRWPVEASAWCTPIGLDDHAESLALAAPRLAAVGARVMHSTLDSVALPSHSATVVTLLDVLEHLDDDEAAVREMTRILKPGGLMVVTVPALRWLWSDWDVTLQHRRRYHEDELRRLLARANLEIVQCRYINWIALLPIALVRLKRRFFPLAPGAPRAEDEIPPAWINTLLYYLFVSPACVSWIRPPAGVSLLAIARVPR